MQWKMPDTVMPAARELEETPRGIANRRSEPRFALTFPIEVCGFERSGRYFVERTSCSDVGELSCAFSLRAEITQDSVLAIRSFHWQNSNIMESMPVLFQVVRLEEVRLEEGRPEGRIVAAVRLHPHVKH
jgi:hypothetical protein